MRPPTRPPFLTLIGSNKLHIKYFSETGELRTHHIVLDHKLGNREGSFDLAGVYFSQSAREVALVGNILHAALSTSRGVWWDNQIEIIVDIPTSSSVGTKPSVAFRRCESLRLKPCRNLRLIGPYLLTAECRQADRSYKDAYLDLDTCLGARNGAFDKEGKNFSRKVTNIQLIGTTLYGDLQTGDGFSRLSIELTSILHVRDGILKPRIYLKSVDYDFEVLKDDRSDHKWLGDTRDVRLVNYRAKRRWYLIADCVTSHGWTRESVFKLHDVFGHYDGEMFPFFTTWEIPEKERPTTFDNGILTASFRAGGKQLIGEEKWIQRSINLSEVVTVEAGMLALKQSGSNCQGCKRFFYAGVLYTPKDGCAIAVDESVVKLMRAHCTFCRLIHDTIKACRHPGGQLQVWIETKGPAARKIYDYPNERTVEIVVRDMGRMYKLRTVLTRKNRLPVREVRALIRREPGTLSNLSEHEYQVNSIPKAFRTLTQNTIDKCWLEPEQRWSTIQDWIEKCATEHSNCQSKSTTEFPSRCLDIGVSDRDTIKLVNSAGNRGSYACLSHCWGGKNICTLNSKTESSFLKAIPPRNLPPVFTSAIAVCRKLGIRYLWIDSLCIRQDSKEDWQVESRRMGTYYSHCTVCIAATGSANSMESFSISPDRPRVVRSAGEDPQSGCFNLVAFPSSLSGSRPHFSHTSKLENLLRHFPLLTRGWVMQERWLAPRVLHFCGSEVVFECADMTTCECGAAGKTIDTEELIPDPLATIRSTTTSSDGLLIRRTALEHVRWDVFVTAYSTLSLTHLTDRLVAISGVASTIFNTQYKSVGEVDRDASTEYLAGLWRQTLARDLAWFIGESLISNMEREAMFEITGSSAERKARPAEYVAPSWSWASVLDPVRYLTDTTHEPLFQLLDAHLSHGTEDPFGSLTRGCFLHLSGKILESSWKLRAVSDGVKLFVLTDLMGTQQLQREDVRGMVFSPDVDLEKTGQDQILSTPKLYVFPLATLSVTYNRWFPDRVRESRTTLSLVLKATGNLQGKSCPVYRRIGFTEYANFRDGTRGFDTNNYETQEFIII